MSVSNSSSSSVQDYRTPIPKLKAAPTKWHPLERAMILEMMLPLQQAQTAAEAAERCAHPRGHGRYRYPTMTKTLDNNFTLHVVEGEITGTQIVAVLGKKGTGRQTFLHLLAGFLELKFNVSTKPRNILISMPSSLRTVRDILQQEIHDSCMMNPKFVCNVMEPLDINLLMDKVMKDLSPAELQSVALCICLGKPADIYVIDGPFANLDVKQRIAAIQAIQWFIRHEKKAAVVVERNFILATELADQFIVIEGEPFVDCTVNAPVSLLAGAELYLSQFDLDDKVRRCPIEFWLDLKKLELEATTKGRE